MNLQLRRVRSRAGLDPRVYDGLVAVLMFGLMATTLASKSPQNGQVSSDVWAYVLSAGMSLPYLTHRRWPIGSMAFAVACLVAYAPPAYVAFPGFPIYALLVGIALHSERRRSLVALVLAIAGLSFALAVQPDGIATGSQWTSTILASLVAWLIGENQRNRRARWAAMEERAARQEQEREEHARRAVTEERLRIARELHDVVAHSMSVIAVQSGMGHHVIDTDPEAAKQALAAIEETSRSSLVEMRRLLGVLRRDEEPSLEPSPGLAELPALLERVRRAGVTTTLETTGDLSRVPTGIDLSAYRIVQEALTNVVRHGGTNAEVKVACTDHELHLEILDDGDGRRELTAVSVTPGNGLIGMRERVAVYGGEFAATRRPVGGFRVTARFPWSDP